LKKKPELIGKKRNIRKKLYSHHPDRELVKPNEDEVDKYGKGEQSGVSDNGQYTIREHTVGGD